MNLDDLDYFKKLDTLNMLGEIDGLPDQLQSAWDLGKSQPLPEKRNYQSVVICGLGGSAIGADLVSAYIASSVSTPVIVHRDMVCQLLQKAKMYL